MNHLRFLILISTITTFLIGVCGSINYIINSTDINMLLAWIGLYAYILFGWLAPWICKTGISEESKNFKAIQFDGSDNFVDIKDGDCAWKDNETVSYWYNPKINNDE